MPEKKLKTTDGTVALFDREIGAVDYAPNQTRKFDIKERPNQLKQLKLHVRVGVDSVLGGGVLEADGPFNLIRQIKIRPSQGTVLKEFPGYTITALNNLEFGTVAYHTAPAALAQGLNEFAFDIIVPFEDHTNIFPERTLLNTMSYNDLTLFINWNPVTAMFVDSDAVLNYVYCDVLMYERPPLSVAEETITRQVMYDNVVSDKLILDTNILLPENTMIKTLMVIARDLNGRRSNNLIARLKVQYDSGDYEIRDLRAGACQSFNKQFYSVETIADGVYVIEFDILHDYRSLFKTKDRNFARLVLESVVPEPTEASVEIFRRRIATQKMTVR